MGLGSVANLDIQEAVPQRGQNQKGIKRCGRGFSRESVRARDWSHVEQLPIRGTRTTVDQGRAPKEQLKAGA